MIHPRAEVDAQARVHPDAAIGPGCIVGPDVEIGAGTQIGPYCVIRGPTHIGRDNRIFQFNSIGDDPQDKKYRPGGESRLEIGDGNTIREFCTVNRGTDQGGGVTRIGDDNWIMAYVHIAHDCIVGNGTILANNATLAGHVIIEDFAILGGFTGVHQFCRVGAYSFSAIGAAVVKDIPPYVLVAGNSARPYGLNREGLRRHGFTPAEIEGLRSAYRILYREQLPLSAALEQLQALVSQCPPVQRLVDFLSQSRRGIAR